MYTLMNKNVPLIDFHWEESKLRGWYTAEDKIYQKPWFIHDLNIWIENRSITKHREHMSKLLKDLGLKNTKSIIDFSKGLALTDTLWINVDDKYTWEKVNLFDNEFDQVIEKIAFDGGMYGAHFSTTSPEFGTDGSFAKCWHREADGTIYLYKQGSSGAANTGKEVYSEMYASQILDNLGYPHVKYDIIQYRGCLVSRCPLFTSQKEMLLPSTVLLEPGKVSFGGLLERCRDLGILPQLAEYMILDAIILNTDRHLGNIGILCDADTFEIKGLSPIYDNGVSLCCYYYTDPRYPKAETRTLLEYAESRIPSLYNDFIEGAVRAASRKQIEHLSVLSNFKFDFSGMYQLPLERVHMLEDLVKQQVSKLQKYVY